MGDTLQQPPGWPRMLELQGMARVAANKGNHADAQIYCEIAKCEAIMAASSDLCSAIGGIATNIDSMEARAQQIVEQMGGG